MERSPSVCVVSMVKYHFVWRVMQQAAKRQESHITTETHTLFILLWLLVFVSCNREIITSSLPVYYLWGGGLRISGIVSVPAYVIYYIIIYCILITDSVGAGAEQQKQRNTSSALITVTDGLPECTSNALHAALQLRKM